MVNNGANKYLRSGFTENGRSNLYLMRESLFSFPVGIALQKDSPYKSKCFWLCTKIFVIQIFRFSTKINQLKEHGFIDHWIAKEQEKVARLDNSLDSGKFSALSMSNLQVKFVPCLVPHTLAYPISGAILPISSIQYFSNSLFYHWAANWILLLLVSCSIQICTNTHTGLRIGQLA